VHDDEYLEYLLGNPSYLRKEMFIMRRLGRWEVGPNVDENVIKAYNKMHVGYKVQVEWEIGGLKRKWK
jgi:3-methyladenine DNA glycosylase/8-oxoguanine DNA glycosylase